MATKTRQAAPVNRIAEVMNNTPERMRRHSPSQKVALIDAILRDAYKSEEFIGILDRYGVNPSAFTRWIQETRA